MEIEITKTKKKLTKQLLSQMFTPTLDELRTSKCLGRINMPNWSKPKLLIQTNGGDYRLLTVGWSLSGRKLYRKYKNGVINWKFESEKDAEEFYTLCQKLNENAEQIYV